jgi:hypothetical protein
MSTEQLTPEDLIEYIESIKCRIEIDKYNLSEECVKQPSLYEEVAGKLSALLKAAKIAKDKVDRVKAELDINIRKDPSVFGLETVKLTESVVASAILTQSKYHDAFDEYLDAEELANRYKVVVVAVEIKKSMLRDLVSLAERDYYQDRAIEPMHSEHHRVSDMQAAQYAKGRTSLRNRRREQMQERSDEREQELAEERRLDDRDETVDS